MYSEAWLKAELLHLCREDSALSSSCSGRPPSEQGLWLEELSPESTAGAHCVLKHTDLYVSYTPTV